MTLAKTAAELRRTADQRPGRNCIHKLPRGLRISIMRRGDRLTLEAATAHGRIPQRPGGQNRSSRLPCPRRDCAPDIHGRHLGRPTLGMG